ncbi:hypothetical protein, partial [Staphylococcus gallinarum]|uniref:hypothetical protein n=1 Tax=Staphylococcus gallinarum TaxID=1293 RepID=UPI000FEE0B19
NVLCKFKTGKDMFIKKVNESQLFLNKYVKSRAYIEGSNLIFNISKNINFNQLLLVKESDNILIDIKQIGDAQFTIPIENIESLVMQEFDRVFLIKDDVAYRAFFNKHFLAHGMLRYLFCRLLFEKTNLYFPTTFSPTPPCPHHTHY